MPGRKIEVTEVTYGNIPPDVLTQEILRTLLHELRLGQPFCYSVNTPKQTNLGQTTLSFEHRK